APAPCECGHTPGRAPFPTRRSSDLLVDALVVPLPVAIHGLVTGIEVRVGVAARGAADAHRAHRAQEPHPRLEPEVLRRERAHGTDVLGHQGVGVIELPPWRQHDLAEVATLALIENVVTDDLVTEAHAAGAHDAPLRVVHDRGPEAHRLR